MAINILKAEQVKSLTYSNEEKNKNSLNDGGGLRIAVKKDNATNNFSGSAFTFLADQTAR